jgi:hypothetical protein
MNMANTHDDEQEFDYRADFERKSKDKAPKARKVQYARTGRAPVSQSSHNGIHRRRNKRFSW